MYLNTIDPSLQIHFITKERLRYPPPADIVSLPVPEENSHFIVNKTVQALLYAAQHYPHKKWFYKCDDDTFVVPSNIKRLLQHFNSEAHYYIGRPLGTSNINSGGAGYVLSRSALQAVKPHLMGCIPVKKKEYGEDMVISSCLESRLGIKATAAPGIVSPIS
ncbi:hypothetical protein BKA69DRAFT_1129901 [Paraphysoderma sedebokerense]|nr:hypothetical protein BKA69DRAFT_1129901 [Paraphysoderma sedebokerense]